MKEKKRKKKSGMTSIQNDSFFLQRAKWVKNHMYTLGYYVSHSLAPRCLSFLKCTADDFTPNYSQRQTRKPLFFSNICKQRVNNNVKQAKY